MYLFIFVVLGMAPRPSGACLGKHSIPELQPQPCNTLSFGVFLDFPKFMNSYQPQVFLKNSFLKSLAQKLVVILGPSYSLHYPQIMSPQILMFYPELFFNLPLHFH